VGIDEVTNLILLWVASTSTHFYDIDMLWQFFESVGSFGIGSD